MGRRGREGRVRADGLMGGSLVPSSQNLPFGGVIYLFIYLLLEEGVEPRASCMLSMRSNT